MPKPSTRFSKPTILFLLTSLSHAQQSPLSWLGVPLLPDSVFVDSTNWAVHTSRPTDTGERRFGPDSVTLDWSLSEVDSSKYVIGTLTLPTSLDLDTFDIFAIDFIGGYSCAGCRQRVSVEFKFEGFNRVNTDSLEQAGIVLHGSAANARWVERIALPKKMFYRSDSIDWTRIQKISMGVKLDALTGDNGAAVGSISFRNVVGSRAENWPRPIDFTDPNPVGGDDLSGNALSFFMDEKNRHSDTSVNYTWPHDSTSNLYGLGILLKIFSINGCWDGGPDSIAVHAARMARAIAVTQHVDGYYARSWKHGVPAYDGDRVWLGDQPWATVGLDWYIKRSGDSTYYQEYRRGIDYLKSTIQEDTTLRVWSSEADSFVEEKSMEAYAALLQAMIEVGETEIADQLAKYILDNTWDPGLKYFWEAVDNPRPVLFTNVWLAEIFRRRGRQNIALDALGFIGRALYTRGPSGPYGVDGFGPYATWHEGGQSYAGAGGPESDVIFAEAEDAIIDGALPAYNEDFFADGHWRTTELSTDATVWLWFTASGLSVFDTSYTIGNCPVSIKPRNRSLGSGRGEIFNIKGSYLGEAGGNGISGHKDLPSGIYLQVEKPQGQETKNESKRLKE